MQCFCFGDKGSAYFRYYPRRGGFILDFNQIPIAKQFIINYFALYIKISTFANRQMI